MKSILSVFLALSASTFGQAPQPPKPQPVTVTPFISATAYQPAFSFRTAPLVLPPRTPVYPPHIQLR